VQAHSPSNVTHVGTRCSCAAVGLKWPGTPNRNFDVFGKITTITNKHLKGKELNLDNRMASVFSMTMVWDEKCDVSAAPDAQF